MTNGNNSISWQRVVGQDSVVEQLPKNSKCFSIPFSFSFNCYILALFIKNINTLGSTKLSYFTNWSEWSVCDRHCTQNRVRRCREKKKCGTTILKVSL